MHQSKQLSLLLILLQALLLQACGGSITNATPAQNVTLEADQGDLLQFEIEGPAPEGDFQYQWVATRYSTQSEVISQEPLTGSSPFNRDYSVSQPDTNALYTEIKVTYGEWKTIGYYEGPIRVFKAIDSVIWEVVSTPQQTPPTWHGDAFIRNQNDLERLRGYETLSGSLLISKANINTSDALQSLANITGDFYALDITQLGDFSRFGFNNQLQLDGNLTIKDSGAIRNLKGLAFLTQPNGITLSNNRRLDSLLGLENVSTLSTLNINQLPHLKNLAELANLSGSVDSVDIWHNSDLESLQGLNNIEHIESLNIGLPQAPIVHTNSLKLVDLQGLNGLTSVGAITIADNQLLQSLAGLENLTTAGSIYLHKNPLLSSLEGLSGLTAVSELELNDLPMLTNLEGLNGVSSIQKLGLHYCDSLQSLSGINQMQLIGELNIGPKGQFNIYETNTQLVDLSGLDSVNEINNLVLGNNAMLLSLAGAPNLTHVDRLSLSYNKQLHDLSAIAGLAFIDELHLYENQNLHALPYLPNIQHLNKLSMTYFHLDHLDGLANLTSVGELSLRYSDSLANIEGLNGLQEASGDFELAGLQSIEQMDLTNLQQVGGNFSLVTNTSLVSFSADNLMGVGGEFLFYGNYDLCTSRIEAFRDQVEGADGIGGTVRIESNNDC